MRLLLDTHVLLWALGDPGRLPGEVLELIEDPRTAVFASAASAWEIELKRKRGRLQAPDDLGGTLSATGIQELAITLRHVRDLADLPPHHPDPFDRLLVAQARVERLTLATHDAALGSYDVDLLEV